VSEEDPDKIIPDDDSLLRGVPPDQWSFEKGRPGTGALNTDDLSVDWSAKRTNDDYIKQHNPDHGLITFKAKLPRSCGLTVKYDPCPPYDKDNDAHTLIPGKKFGNFFKAVKREGDIIVVKAAVKQSDD
jgi:hypothetical protein